MQETISKEFADRLVEDSLLHNAQEKPTIELWKLKGYIKQSREDEIREALALNGHSEIAYVSLLKELVEILDKKNKDEKEIELSCANCACSIGSRICIKCDSNYSQFRFDKNKLK